MYLLSPVLRGQDYRAIIYPKMQFGNYFLAKLGLRCLHFLQNIAERFLQQTCAEIALHSVRQDCGDDLIFAVFLRHLFAGPDVGAG